MFRQIDTSKLLFGFVIDDVHELKELLESFCVIGGNTRLISFDIEDGYVTIQSLDPECNRIKQQFREEDFIEAKFGGRNRHGKQVVYVKDAELLVVTITVSTDREPEEYGFEAIIDEDKIWTITKYINV